MAGERPHPGESTSANLPQRARTRRQTGRSQTHAAKTGPLPPFVRSVPHKAWGSSMSARTSTRRPVSSASSRTAAARAVSSPSIPPAGIDVGESVCLNGGLGLCKAPHCQCDDFNASGRVRKEGTKKGSPLCVCGHIESVHTGRVSQTATRLEKRQNQRVVWQPGREGMKRTGRVSLWLTLPPVGLWRSVRHGKKKHEDRLAKKFAEELRKADKRR